MKTNSERSITLHQMKQQTCRVQKMKAYYHIYDLRARQLIPIEQSRAENDQRWSAPTFLWMRRWANIILTGIALRQYSTCSTSYKLCFFQSSSSLVRFHVFVSGNHENCKKKTNVRVIDSRAFKRYLRVIRNFWIYLKYSWMILIYCNKMYFSSFQTVVVWSWITNNMR